MTRNPSWDRAKSRTLPISSLFQIPSLTNGRKSSQRSSIKERSKFIVSHISRAISKCISHLKPKTGSSRKPPSSSAFFFAHPPFVHLLLRRAMLTLVSPGLPLSHKQSLLYPEGISFRSSRCRSRSHPHERRTSRHPLYHANMYLRH